MNRRLRVADGCTTRSMYSATPRSPAPGNAPAAGTRRFNTLTSNACCAAAKQVSASVDASAMTSPCAVCVAYPILSKQVPDIVLHMVSDVQGQGLYCRGGIDRAAGNQDAAVDDIQVRHVMAPPVRIHHGVRPVCAHARGAHEMPTSRAQQGIDLHLHRPGSLQHFGGAGDAVGHHLAAVVAQRIDDLGSRDAVAIGELWI